MIIKVAFCLIKRHFNSINYFIKSSKPKQLFRTSFKRSIVIIFYLNVLFSSEYSARRPGHFVCDSDLPALFFCRGGREEGKMLMEKKTFMISYHHRFGTSINKEAEMVRAVWPISSRQDTSSDTDGLPLLETTVDRSSEGDSLKWVKERSAHLNI